MVGSPNPKSVLGRLRFKLALSLVVFFSFFPGVAEAQDGLYPYVKTVTITAYYSPCEGQSYYVTGTYDGDIRLNGRGTNGADGTPVYPGMIAAPSTYPFGTKISIPGIGMTAVHDRGGAIVPAGERGESYDRLDVWMGWCEPGLDAALSWGKKTLDVMIYGTDPSIQDEVYMEVTSHAESIVKTVILAPQLFEQDLWYLSSGEDVERLQVYLKELGYFPGEITGYYGEETRQAVYAFQVDQEIVKSWDDLGAGHLGVNTRKMLDLAISKMRDDQDNEELQRYQKGLLLLDQYDDLNKNRTAFSYDLALGTSGEEVRRLQEELVTLGYLRVTPTGYYGEVTQHAVFKFQQKMGLVGTSTDAGAGIFGPQTRTRLNTIVGERTTELSYVAYNRTHSSSETVASAPSDAGFSRVMTYGDRGTDVKTLQSLLKQLGFFRGGFLTEFYGEQTRTAVIEFQLANGLIASADEAGAGTVRDDTLNLLNSLL